MRQHLLLSLFLVVFLQWCYGIGPGGAAAANIRLARQAPEDVASTAEEEDAAGLDAADAPAQPLRVVSILTPPYLMLRSDNEVDGATGNDRYEGYAKDLADLLTEKLGREYVISLSPDGHYGLKNSSTGSWTGMVGALEKGDADLAIADLTITSPRMEAIDFSMPFMTSGISLLVTKKYAEESASDPERIKSIDDIGRRLLAGADDLPVDFGMIQRGSTRHLFETSHQPHLRRMHEYLESHPQHYTKSVAEGVMRARDSAADGADKPYAFIIESWTNDYVAGRYPCDTIQLGDNIDEKLYGLGVPKNNYNLLADVNKYIMQLRETGQIEELRRKWWTPDERCAAGRTAAVEPEQPQEETDSPQEGDAEDKAEEAAVAEE